MKDIIYSHFKLPADPWAGRHLRSRDAERVSRAVKAALNTGALLEIVGQRGSGKTQSVWRALRPDGAAAQFAVVEPLRLDRERLSIADIQRAIIETLSNERPAHSGEERTGQTRRVLKDFRFRAVLLIDDAHLLHHSTIAAIKRLRELGSQGQRRSSITVILTGQRSAVSRVPEVGLRSQSVVLQGLTRKEAQDALAGALGKSIDEAAAKRIAASADGRNWLDLERRADECLAAAMAAGAARVTADIVAGSDGDGKAAELPGQPGQVSAMLGGGRKTKAA